MSDESSLPAPDDGDLQHLHLSPLVMLVSIPITIVAVPNSTLERRDDTLALPFQFVEMSLKFR